jgi:hypothetical protein
MLALTSRSARKQGRPKDWTRIVSGDPLVSVIRHLQLAPVDVPGLRIGVRTFPLFVELAKSRGQPLRDVLRDNPDIGQRLEETACAADAEDFPRSGCSSPSSECMPTAPGQAEVRCASGAHPPRQQQPAREHGSCPPPRLRAACHEARVLEIPPLTRHTGRDEPSNS